MYDNFLTKAIVSSGGLSLKIELLNESNGWDEFPIYFVVSDCTCGRQLHTHAFDGSFIDTVYIRPWDIGKDETNVTFVSAL